MDLKTLILAHVSDLVSDFLYYDRKEDEELDRDTLDRAFRDGTITINEVVNKFKHDLIEGLKC